MAGLPSHFPRRGMAAKKLLSEGLIFVINRLTLACFSVLCAMGRTSMPLYTNSLNHTLAVMALPPCILPEKKAYIKAKASKLKKYTVTRKNICSHKSLIHKVGRSEDEKVH
jgi:hypothetical protein